MNAPAFIDGLQARGATLQLEGEALRVTPSNALTDADRAAWREHKREIIAWLETASKSAQTSTQASSAPPREFRVRDVYEPARAYAYAAQLLRRGEITREQCDNLQRYAMDA